MTKILVDKAVIEQALDALFMYKPIVTGVTFQHGLDATKALRAVLEQEPVAWQYRMRPDWGSKKDCWGPWQDCTKEQAAMYQRVPLLHDWAYESRQLYTHPQPHRQPLTEERIMDLVRDGCEDMRWPSTALTIFRTAERAHGIGGES